MRHDHTSNHEFESTNKQCFFNLFSVEIAEKFQSVDLALIFEYFRKCIHMSLSDDTISFERKIWIRRSINEIAYDLPYFSISKVRRLINKALELNIIIKKNFNKDKTDKTYWYTFANEENY